MNEIAIIKRKIQLKRQALQLIKDEIGNLQERLALIILKTRFEEKIESDNDPSLGRKLDCIQFLLEN